MKLNRLIGILSVLQRKGEVTTPYLAEKFEVSVRTISRDIETLCQAGIPIVSRRGKGGGVALMDGYALDTTLFTQGELSAIFTGLRSLDSVGASAGLLAEKLGMPPSGPESHMVIDLASFYKQTLTRNIRLICEAIDARKCLRFLYCYPKGEEQKLVEPYWVVYQWSDWYLFGFCRKRQDFRLYKLRRLWDLETAGDSFQPREVPEEKTHFGAHITDGYMVTALYDPSVKYRLVEEYGHQSFQTREDGRLYARWGFRSQESALDWLLGFGDKVRVLDPPELAERIRQIADQIKNLYET